MRDPAPGDDLDGYLLERVVARGGMATVFRAREPGSGAVVALKVPSFQYEADVVFYERFRREEELGLRLDHPNIVRTLRPVAVEKSRLYMVMEYVEGRTLASMLEGHPLPPDRALDLTRQTAEALAYLHGQGVLHRDVKPGNILVTPDGRAKLLDFGLAHSATAGRLTIAGLTASMGTPAYMAPEQMRGRTGDARSDVYALGVMLYQLLTAHLPYEEADLDALLRAKRLQDPTSPSKWMPDLDPGLETTVMRAIQLDPGDRFPSADALLAALRDPSAIEPLPGPGVDEPPRRRRDLRLGAALAAVVAALTLIGWVGWYAQGRPPASIPVRDALPNTSSAGTSPLPADGARR
jgi:serine/threonine-protein kinase